MKVKMEFTLYFFTSFTSTIMKLLLLPVLSLIPQVLSLKILIGNDDSWGTANIKSLYQALQAEGHDVLLAAPVMQQSGTNGKMREPKKLEKDSEFGLAKKGAPAEGNEQDDGE